MFSRGLCEGVSGESEGGGGATPSGQMLMRSSSIF